MAHFVHMHKFHGKHTSYKQFILFMPFLYTTSNWCSCIISLKHWRLFTSVSVYCPLPFLQFLHISMLISSSYFPSCFCLCLPLSFSPLFLTAALLFFLLLAPCALFSCLDRHISIQPQFPHTYRLHTDDLLAMPCRRFVK